MDNAPTIAYIANEFPSPVEHYVVEEIRELRRRSVPVIPCSVRRPASSLDGYLQRYAHETLYLLPLHARLSASSNLAVFAEVAPALHPGVAGALLWQGNCGPPFPYSPAHLARRMLCAAIARARRTAHSCPPWLLRFVDRAGGGGIIWYHFQPYPARLRSPAASGVSRHEASKL